MSRAALAAGLRRVALLLTLPGGEWAARRMGCEQTRHLARRFRELGSWRVANWLLLDHARRSHAGGPCPELPQEVSGCCAAPVTVVGNTGQCTRCLGACAAVAAPWWLE